MIHIHIRLWYLYRWTYLFLEYSKLHFLALISLLQKRYFVVIFHRALYWCLLYVRGSPLIVIMVLTMVLDKHIPCLRHLCNPVVYLSAGVHQSREQFNSRPVPSEAKSMRDFFHSWILCGACTWCARQLIVNVSKMGSSQPDCNGRVPGAANPGVEGWPPPEHDVAEGFMALVKTRSDCRALICTVYDRNDYVS